LPPALARQAEPAANVLERLRLRVVEAVTEDDHLSLAIRERRQRLRKRLAPQRSLDRLLRERIVVRHEVAEDSVFLLADRLVETRRRARGCTHPLALGDAQVPLPRHLLDHPFP